MVLRFPRKLDPPVDAPAARAAMLKERAAVTAESGLAFVYLRCGHCAFEADGNGTTKEVAIQQALKGLGIHIANEHGAA